MTATTESARLSVPVTGVFCGQPQAFGPKGQRSAIVKQAVTGPVWCGPDGLDGDAQADLKHHGGANQAVHYFPAEHYRFWAEEAPDLADNFQPGRVGENLSGEGLTDDAVCLADIFKVGEAELEVTQPRAPCWKFGRRLGRPQLIQASLQALCVGWYLRVRRPGYIQAGQQLELIARPRPHLSVATATRVLLRDRDDPEALAALAEDTGLSPKIRADAAKLLGHGS